MLSITIIIIVIISLVSIKAFNDDHFLIQMAFKPYQMLHNKDWKQMLTHIFVHADWTHLLFNMMSLYFLGKYLEIQLVMEYGMTNGLIHYAIIFVVGGVFATFWPLSRNKDNPNYTSLGASGAVSAVIFAFIMWNPTVELALLFIPIPIPAYIFGPLYLGFEYWAFKKNRGNIAHDAHLGGAFFGIFYIILINFDKLREILAIFGM